MVLYSGIDISMPKGLSHTACEVFEECPLHFLFDYRAHLTPEKDPYVIEYSIAGNVVHKTIKQFFDNIERIDLKTIIDPYDFIRKNVANALYQNKEVIEDPSLKARIKDDINKCLEHFVDFMTNRFNCLDELGKLDSLRPYTSELWVTSTIKGVPFNGRIDAVFNDTEIRLVDWKTNKTKNLSKQKRQAVRYVVLFINRNGKRPNYYPINLRYPVNMHESRIQVDDLMMKEEENHVMRLWDKACGSIFEKRKSFENCIFCDHKLKCKNFPDITDLNILNSVGRFFAVK